jgi:hypothetical protein
MKYAVLVAVVVAAALGAFFLFRGGGEPTVSVYTAPFARAIEDYLSDKNMDMKVTEFESIQVQDGTATAVCRMQQAGDLYTGLAVRWRFTFDRSGDGEWRAVEHEPL